MAKLGLHLQSTCEHCGAAYRQSRSNQRYCSNICAMRHRRQVRAKPACLSTCFRCGQVFSRVNSQQKYCSAICARAAENDNKKAQRSGGPGKGWNKGKTYVERQTCQRCGNEFYAPPVLKRRGGGKFCSNDCRTAHIATHPELFPQIQGRRGNGGKRADLDNRYFRSSWEANWARYLNWLVQVGEIKSWEYEVDTFEFTKIKRGQRFYTPDFKVTNRDDSIEYHEVKGYMDQPSHTKLDRMARYYPKVKVIVIDKPAYTAIATQFKRRLPGWE